ncbi:MAG: hypothetical protein II795_05270 [Firmicutes bacterium]|nr:hypothetical protein [Bacillota bacterium]
MDNVDKPQSFTDISHRDLHTVFSLIIGKTDVFPKITAPITIITTKEYYNIHYALQGGSHEHSLQQNLIDQKCEYSYPRSIAEDNDACLTVHPS